MQGQPFAPHPRLEAILDNAARTAAAISRVLVYAPRDPDAIIFEGSSWRRAFIGGRPRWSLPRPGSSRCRPGLILQNPRRW